MASKTAKKASKKTASAKPKKASKPKKTESTGFKVPDGHDVKRVKFNRELETDLTREEVEARSQEMSDTIRDRDIREAEFKEHAKANRDIIKGMDIDIRRLNSAVQSKSERRNIICERIVDYTSNVVTDVRTDTGEVVHRRALEAIEKQKSFEFKPADIEDEFNVDEEPASNPEDTKDGKPKSEEAEGDEDDSSDE